MNVALWLMAGGIAGWIGIRFLNANEGRGTVMSIVIGIAGGFFGGNIVAPMFSEIAHNPGAFSPFALFMAVASAAALLTISDMLSRRYGV